MEQMITTPELRNEESDAIRRGIWIALLTGASIVFSIAFKCAMPFAALATLAAMNMQRRDAVALVAMAWLVNQAIGFGLLHYPHTLETYTWGAAIGAAALLALGAAMGVAALERFGRWGATGAAFAAAFVAYEAALYATSLLMGEGLRDFTPPIVAKVLEIDALGLVGLLVLHQAALGLKLVEPRLSPRSLAAGA